jgi:outer membrane protein insertion porin family
MCRPEGGPGSWLLTLAVIAGVAALALSTGQAQFRSDDTVQEIRVQGTQRIDPETVRSYMNIGIGDRFDPERMDRSLKRLFSTGYFSDVVIDRQGSALLVRVVENPIINRIAFEGNDELDDETLSAEVQLRPRIVYTRTRVQNDVRRLLELYRRSGRFAASIEPKVIALPQNRVDLAFEIDEGPKTKVQRIVFIGNRRFSDSRLASEIQTEEARWYRFLTSDDTYDPDRLLFDQEKLRKFYFAQGYADFRVASAIAELTPGRGGFIVTFTIEEGQRYKFGKIDVASRLPDLNLDAIRSVVTTQTGEWYDADEIDKSIDALTDEVGRYGYAFIDIRPQAQRRRNERLVDVTYEIGEGPRVYVGRIEIQGNTRTLDKVIRREFRLVEGDAFNTAKLRRSRQRIRNLGFFEKVDVKSVPGDRPDRTVIKVDVAEQATGEIALGAGFSSAQGALADFSVRERNLLGRGQDLRLGLSLSQRQQQIDLSFTEPYFRDRPISAGFDVFSTRRDESDESSFELNSLGFALRTGYRITENLRHGLRYTLKQDKIEDLDDDASEFIKAEEGSAVTSMIGHKLNYDKRDSRFEPTEGYILGLSNDFAGIGGSVDYVRSTLSGAQYYQIADQWILSIRGKIGYIISIGDDDIRLNDRFFIGGDDLRGFDDSGIGPRDRVTDDALGGNRFFTSSVQLRFPFGLPKELGVFGSVFADAGTLGDIDASGANLLDEESIRASLGTGLSWRSPFGPLAVSFGFAVIKEDFDQTKVLRFSFGTRF